jgi:hypothetical protein
LKPVLLPHPSQLRDLGCLPTDDLSNLAQVLKQVKYFCLNSGSIFFTFISKYLPTLVNPCDQLYVFKYRNNSDVYFPTNRRFLRGEWPSTAQNQRTGATGRRNSRENSKYLQHFLYYLHLIN